MDNKKSIGTRIKDLRELSDITQEEAAGTLGITLSAYKHLESSGGKDISIGQLHDIAALFKVDPMLLIGGEDFQTGCEPFAVYEGDGTPVKRYEGYTSNYLAAGFKGRRMEPMIVTLTPGVAPELVQHQGQEFNYVLEGKLRLLYDNKEYYLREGESIIFDPKTPHAQVAMDGKPARFLTVVI